MPPRYIPRVWDAMRKADAPDTPYDTDALSRELDARFTALFGRDCAALWVATGTAANCLALATMVEPHGGVICHREAHIEMDECGAPGFYLHGAKLLLAEGDGAKLTPEGIGEVLAGITRGVHQVPAQAVSITQASEYGLAYRPDEVVAIGALAQKHGLGLHMDGARFANAVAVLGLRACRCGRAGRCAELRLRQERRDGGRSDRVLRSRQGRSGPLAAQTRGAFAEQGPLSRGADAGDAGGRSVARRMPALPMRRRR